MKYFFLTEGWKVGRIWAAEGLWQTTAWRRQPEIQRIDVSLEEKNEVLWLHRVEDTIVMVEVMPILPPSKNGSGQKIGQVVLKRLMSAEQVIDRLACAETRCLLQNIQSVVN
ncbi:MAG: hypothetical protein QNJ49_06985 [Mastigocoleus sp. MO_167.B18]|uniref:hypothetical protein n=1 Tax=Mastigocoleus sp. MO_188.B34 TaxID=3036635 RepID=UPI00261D59C3|nr:hypothetical protein [Mastigocoleus sp. MO_188.B34]MDJ0693042.1 hypothetical protein [Mastigocoleus sp. MO_188.B34]MDJ0773160.1 hypothetical protein [Mastigocoleus sp. MO_167.B18]